jgi:uncharacterized protein (DUF305 family)
MWHRTRRTGVVLSGALCAGWLVARTSESPHDATVDDIGSELHAAMMEMDDHMSAPVKGSVDQVFVAMMVPHHQGAIDMARIQLRYSHNPQIIRICQEIIVEQQQEIAVMNRAVGTTP